MPAQRERPPRTSFLLPARDAASTLGEAIGSLLAQSDPDFEVLVADDGSRDDTRAVALGWAGRDERVRVLSAPDEGLPEALNFGLRHCRGRYVARMDADDVALPQRLARQLPVLEAQPEVAVTDGMVELFREDGPVPEGMARFAAWQNSILQPEDFDREIMVGCSIVHPAATYRRQEILEAGGYRDGPFPEDYELWLRLHAAGRRFLKLPEVLVRMRDHERRLTRTHPAYGRQAFRRVRQAWRRATVLAQPRRVVLWGGGKGGRPWLRWLVEQGHHVVAVVDIDPKKIGNLRRGCVPVVAPAELAQLRADLCLVAVGTRGARDLIRASIARLRPDWREGRDWWALA